MVDGLCVDLFTPALQCHLAWAGCAGWTSEAIGIFIYENQTTNYRKAENALSSLIIDSVKKTDTGFYSLVAQSEGGTSTSHCLVTVTFPPGPKDDQNSGCLKATCTD